MLKAEFHIHTKEDPLDAIKYSAKQAISYCSKLKYEVMSITCHTKILFNKELKDYAKQKN